MPRLCMEMGINEMALVKQQEAPDPDFPTVKFPNPEEAGALDLAMETGDALDQDLIIANDPDADRLAVVQKVKYVLYQLIYFYPMTNSPGQWLLVPVHG